MVTLSRDGGEEIDARCSRARQLRLRCTLLHFLIIIFFINMNLLFKIQKILIGKYSLSSFFCITIDILRA